MEAVGAGDDAEKNEPATEVGEESSVEVALMGLAHVILVGLALAGGCASNVSWVSLYLGDIVAYNGTV